MAPLASQVQPKTLDVPGSPGQRVTIRKLGWTGLRAALHVKGQRGLDFIRRHGKQAFTQELERHGGEAAVRAAGEADPVLQYDAATLIHRAVLSWDPPRAAPPEEGSELAAWLAREIVAFADPRSTKGVF